MIRILVSLCLMAIASASNAQPDPKALVRSAMDHWRGVSSHADITMIIHRPDWERSMSMRNWTLGDKHSLVRVTAPAKDAGNGTLLKDNNMWTYTPKINRVIKVPSSMMSQSWMGSDLSNKDISKSTDIIDQYDHTLMQTREEAGHTIYVIRAIPHEDAAVVWGKEVITIRDDYTMLEQQFWDQDGELVKTFVTSEIKNMGGRAVATVMRMQEVDKPDQWTEMQVNEIAFDVDLPGQLVHPLQFAQSASVSVTGRLAWRNLWRHGRRTWLTVGAMIFCNALLVFMISFQFGTYVMMIDGTLSMLTGHLQVQHKDYNEEPRMRRSIPDGVALAASLRERAGLDAMAARSSAFALASSEERSFGIQILGVQPQFEPAVSTLPGLVSEGRYLQGDDAQEIVIGSVLARNLKVALGDEITFLGSGRDGSFAAGIATIVGIIDSGMPDLDRAVAQIPLQYFQSIFTMEGQVHSIVAVLDQLSDVAIVKQQLNGLLSDPQLTVLDWNELQPGLRQAIQADLFSAFVMYAVLIVLVAFSVLNTQLMSVLERTREFGVMMALGLRPGGLGWLVLLETAMMSLLGLVLGCLLGAAIGWYFQQNGIHVPGMEEAMAKYNLPGALYPQVSLLSVLLGPSIVFVGGMLAAIYPALRLHTLQPVTAMRAV